VERDQAFEELWSGVVGGFGSRPAELRYSNLESFDEPTQVYAISLGVAGGFVSIVDVVHDPTRATGVTEAFVAEGIDDLTSSLDARSAEFAASRLPVQYEFPELAPSYSYTEELALGLSVGKNYESLLATAPDGEWQVVSRTVVQTVPNGSRMVVIRKPPLPTPSVVLEMLGGSIIAEAQPPTTPSLQLVPVLEAALAAYADPPVRFGEPPFPSASDLLRGTTRERHLQTIDDDIICRGEVGGVELLVSRKCRVVARTTDRIAGRAAINQFMAVLGRSGLSQLAVNDDDLLEVSNLDPESGQMGSWNGRALLERNDRFGLSFRSPRYTNCYLVSAEEAQVVLRAASDCAASTVDSVRSLRLFDAVTLFYRGHATEAFIVAWSIIEDWVEDKFMSYWRSKSRPNRRIRESLLNWTAAQRIDLLLAGGVVEPHDFGVIDDLRSRRNKVVHDLQTASDEDAKVCVNTAVMLCRLPSADLKPRVFVFGSFT